MSDKNEHENIWVIGERSIPPPSGSSDVMRSSVENTPIPDVTERLQFIPKTGEEWLAYIAERESEMMEFVEPIIEQAPVSIEPGEIDGVKVFHVIPENIDPRHKDHLFVCVHGGGYSVEKLE